MDKVTHFLFLTTLILIIICCVIWLLTVSCTAGIMSKYMKGIHNFFEQRTKEEPDNFIREKVREVSGMAKEVAKGYENKMKEDYLLV